MTDAGDGPIIRAWVRAAWRLPDGRTVVRTARRDVTGDPEDEGRAIAIVQEFIEELGAEGYLFADGRGTLIEVVGTMAG